jgi:hypothetical protein
MKGYDKPVHAEDLKVGDTVYLVIKEGNRFDYEH